MASRRILSLCTAALVFAGATDAVAQSAPKIRLWGSSATVEANFGPLFLGNPLGFFKQEGVEVEFGSAAGSSATLQLIAANQVQIGNIGMDVLILGKARAPDLPVTAVYLHDRGNMYEICVPDAGDIKAVKDLKDKTIGVANLASGALPSLRATLQDAGLDPNSAVGLVPVGSGAQAAAALKSDRVQALALFRAQHAVIETLGFKFRCFSREAPSAVLAVNTNFLRDNREAVIKTLRSVAKGSIFTEINPEATVRKHWELFGRPQGLTEEEALRRAVYVVTASAKLWKDYRDPSLKWGAMTKQQWQDMQKFLIDQKVLDRPVPVETLFTSDLIDALNDFDANAVIELAKSTK